MIGAIAGDMVGSIYEQRQIKTKDFPLFDERCRFTDDTVLTVAVADAILKGGSYLDSVRRIGRRYPRAGYGGSFMHWLHSDDPPPLQQLGKRLCNAGEPRGVRFFDRGRGPSAGSNECRDHPQSSRGNQGG
jgi:hypothetical protein